MTAAGDRLSLTVGFLLLRFFFRSVPVMDPPGLARTFDVAAAAPPSHRAITAASSGILDATHPGDSSCATGT